MANELDIQLALRCYKPSAMSSAIGRALILQATMTGRFTVEGTILVGVTATLVPLGQVVQPHWSYFKNLDATNFIDVLNGSRGNEEDDDAATIIKLLPGEAAIFPMLDTAVPYATADTAACLMEYLIISL